MIRHRYAFLIIGCSLAIGCSIYSDPDHGLATALSGLDVLQGIIAVAAAHWCRKALLDYEESDQRSLFKKASETSIGSSIALIAVAIIFSALLIVFAPRAHASELPPGAIKYIPLLKVEQQHYWPSHPQPALLASLIEQESCISLKSAKCWNPQSRLKTKREEGAGLGQITRTRRFDALKELQMSYKAELAEWSWQNVYDRPQLQLRAIVLMNRDNAKRFGNNIESLKFGDAAYNGGVNGTMRERRACKLSNNCDPIKWFNNVELHCLKSHHPLYAQRSPCDINREHVKNVFNIRLNKYIGVL